VVLAAAAAAEAGAVDNASIATSDVIAALRCQRQYRWHLML